MKIAFLILIIILIYSSFDKQEIIEYESLLDYVESYATLKLETVDEKCGEWGGDKEVILIYRDLRKETFYVDYLKEMVNCDEPFADSSKNKGTYKKRIVMDLDAQKIAKSCVDQLVIGNFIVAQK